MLKKIILIGFLFISGTFNCYADALDSAKYLCKEKMAKNQPKISVILNFGELKYDYSKNEKEIKDLFLKVNPNIPLLYGDIQGLTDTSPFINTSIDIKRQIVLNKFICSIPEEVTIYIRYNKPTVYLLNSLREGSCAYRLAKRHEQAHLDISHTALILLSKTVKNKLPEIINNVGPYVSYVDDNENAAQKLNTLYQSYLIPIIEVFNNTLIQQHSRLDSEENYKKETQLCK